MYTRQCYNFILAARLRRACFIGMISLFLAFWQACVRNPARENSPKTISEALSAEQLVINYLGKIYERPRNDRWEEGRVYFIPEKSGLVQLPESRHDAAPKNIEVFKASVWFTDWGPEESVVLVWVVREQGQPQLGVLSGPDEIVARFPQVLRGLTFDRPEDRRSLALLVGEMTAAFYGKKSTDLQALPSERNCEWVGLRASLQDQNRRVSGSCFSSRGVLEQVILVRRNWYG
jgi:hypothetical protein